MPPGSPLKRPPLRAPPTMFAHVSSELAAASAWERRCCSSELSSWPNRA